MFLQKDGDRMLFKRNRPADNSSSKQQISDQKIKFRPESGKLNTLFKGIFNAATQISSFDLKLAFSGDRIVKVSNRLQTMTTGVASASEEISISTDQIVNANMELAVSIGKIAEDAQVLRQNTAKSSELLQDISTENDAMMVFSKDMQISVHELLSVIHKINSTVKSINKISEQTKLLSLNASIEAARAGAAGKGFAVVAGEIKSLSDTTKTLTSEIDTLLEEINRASIRSADNVDKTVASVTKVNQSTGVVSEMMKNNFEAIGHISDRMSEVSATSEEMNASIQECSASLESLNSDIQSLSQSAEDLRFISGSIQEISTSISEVENDVNDLAVQAGKLLENKAYGFSNEDFIQTVEHAIHAHKAWIANLKTMAETMKPSPIQTDEHKCGFGHFYYAVSPSSDQMSKLWMGVEQLHHDLHKKGDTVLDAISRRDSAAAQAAVAEADSLSVQIIEQFVCMIDIVKDMSRSGRFVF